MEEDSPRVGTSDSWSEWGILAEVTIKSFTSTVTSSMEAIQSECSGFNNKYQQTKKGMNVKD